MHSRRAPPPLNEQKLRDLALRYVGRYATSRAKLRAYLQRKVRERGWDAEREPDFAGIVERFTEQGFIDDAGFATAKARTLTSRGYGKRRVVEALRTAGIEDADGEDARRLADAEAVAAALRYAERRRLGPFAIQASDDPRDRQKAIAAMVRAGHGFPLARTIVMMRPDQSIDHELLRTEARLVLP